MRVETRVVVILMLVFLITAPAAVFRALCLGRSCDRESSPKRDVPFCSLPADTRRLIAAGYREGRSPDVLAVTEPGIAVVEGQGSSEWPSLDEQLTPAAVIFAGKGVEEQPDATIGLDDIAPTMASILEFRVPHPEVRSGRPNENIASDKAPRLLLLLVMADVDPTEMRFGFPKGVGATHAIADPVSLPSDPAAFYATIGTGGPPAQHGVTGVLVRDYRDHLADSWKSPFARLFGSNSGFPGTVIATLADDLDDVMHQKPRIGLVAADHTARGLIGGNWYIDGDRDERIYEPEPQVAIHAAKRMMRSSGFGQDKVPDILAISIEAMDLNVAHTIDELFRTADKAAGGRAAIIAIGVPVAASVVDQIPVDRVIEHIERATSPGIVEGSVAGGLFLDQDELAETGISKDEVVRTMRAFDSAGARVFADVFSGMAVSFADYC